MLVYEEKTKTQIRLFEEQKVRTVWNSEKEEWYFSVVDVVGILTESENPRNYWKVLKHRLSEEGSQLVTNCNQLKMPAADGKMYKTEIVEKNDIIFPNESINEDVCFNVWYWACCETKTWIDIPSYLWKENPNSITRKNNHEYIYTSFCPLCRNLQETFIKMFANTNIPFEKK